MKLVIESTDQMCDVNGTGCRVWEGKSERGTPVMAFIPVVLAKDDKDQEEFERDLIARTKDASPAVRALPRKLDI